MPQPCPGHQHLSMVKGISPVSPWRLGHPSLQHRRLQKNANEMWTTMNMCDKTRMKCSIGLQLVNDSSTTTPPWTYVDGQTSSTHRRKRCKVWMELGKDLLLAMSVAESGQPEPRIRSSLDFQWHQLGRAIPKSYRYSIPFDDAITWLGASKPSGGGVNSPGIGAFRQSF